MAYNYSDSLFKVSTDFFCFWAFEIFIILFCLWHTTPIKTHRPSNTVIYKNPKIAEDMMYIVEPLSEGESDVDEEGLSWWDDDVEEIKAVC